MDITRDAIIDAYRRTEILPVAHTWDTRAHVDAAGNAAPEGREVACGCALVALCRAAGIDPEPIIAGARHSDRSMGLGIAAALGLSAETAFAVMCGWDRWPHAPSEAWDVRGALAAYLAAWEAAAAVLGPRYEREIAGPD